MEQDVLRAFEKKCIQEEPAYCTAACPFHMDVKTFLGHMGRKDQDKAFKVLEQSLPLPELMARICDHPCENQCIRKELDTALSIGMLERACVTSRTKQKKRFVLPARGKTVGVWGSGLSSLTAAWDLALKGYGVTIFDQAEILGGHLLRLPGTLLPAELLAREIKALETYGVCFQTAVLPDSVFWAEQIMAFDAIFLGFDGPKDPCPGIAYDETGTPRVDPFTLQTSNPKIFAGGFSDNDSDKGGAPYQDSYPVALAAQGRKAATTIDRVLSRVSISAGREKQGVCQTRLTTDISQIRTQPPMDPRCDPKNAAAGYDLERAAQEAARCIQCDCSRCVRVCTYINAFKGFPGKYAREIYNNSAIVMGERKANLLINSCSLCSLCERVCPNDFSMADLCLYARQEMVESGKMPVSAHEFALQEMAFASGKACSFVRHAPGSDTSDQIFFPGCQLLGSAPFQVETIYNFLRAHLPGNTGFVSGCCGAPGVWAGQKALAKESLAEFKAFWEASGKPCIITACSSCTTLLTQALENATITSLFQVMAAAPLAGQIPDPANGVSSAVNIIDPCTARDDTLVQTAVRTLARSAGITISELPASGQLTECCGFGGLVFTANPVLSKQILQQRADQSDQTFLAYCAMCRDRLASTGKKVVHVLDLFWPSTDHPENRKDPGFSLRHDNLARAKQELLARVWKETYSRDASQNQAVLIISPEVAQVLEDQFILRSDIQKVIHQFESGADYFVYPENNSIICCFRPVRVWFWVEFRKTENKFEILNAWSHRMEVIANKQFVEGTPTHGADETVLCHTCNHPLTPYKNHVEYLGSRFDVALPQCRGCGKVYVSPALAHGKMAEVEKILEDK